MKIKYLYAEHERVETVERFMENFLDGADYGDGLRIATASATATNATQALGRLCAILIAKGQLTLTELVEVSGAYFLNEKDKPVIVHED